MIYKLIISFLIFFTVATPSKKEEIIEMMEGYNNAFGLANYPEIISYFDLPTSFNLQEKTITAPNKFKLKLIYKKLRGSLPDYYSYSKWEKVDIELIDNNIAIINAEYSRYNSNNEIFESGSAQYYLRFKDNHWKIFSLTPYKTIKPLP